MPFAQFQSLRQQGLSVDQIVKFEGGAKPQQQGGGILDTIGNAGKSIGDAFTNFIFPKNFQNSIAGVGSGTLQNGLGGEAQQYAQQQAQGQRPTDLQTAGGAAQAALNFGSFAMPMAGSVAGRIGQAAGLGAGYGATGALQDQNPSAGGVLGGALTGAATGAATGGLIEGAGKLASGLFDKLPQGIIKNAVPSKEAGVAGTILNSPIEGLQTKLTTAEARVKESAGAVDNILQFNRYKPGTPEWEQLILENPKLPLATEGIDKSKLFTKVATEFGRRGGAGTVTGSEVENIIAKQVPGAAGFLSNDYITPTQMNEIGRIINTDKPQIYNLDRVGKFNEQVLKSFSTIARQTVKKIAPETVPLLADQAEQIPVRNALGKLLKKHADKGVSISGFKKGVAAATGAVFGGVPGAALGYGIESALESPSVDVIGAQMLNRIGRPAQFIGSQLKRPVQTGLLNALVKPKINKY